MAKFGLYDWTNNSLLTLEDKNLKRLIKSFGIFSFLLLAFSVSAFAKNVTPINISSDSTEIIAQYSLFSEYYKNKDYQSALPYGWHVLDMNPDKFSKWIYYKMEDSYWYLHDSSNASEQEISSINDTILTLYNMAIKHYPDAKGYFQVRKAYVMQNWLNLPADTVIAAYEKALEWDPNISTYYKNLLGQLYKNNASDNNDYKNKALDLYTKLSEQEPDNPQWPNELESLVENIDQLVQLNKKAWEFDKDNLAKAWKYANMAIRANDYQQAITPLEFLVEKSPETVNYWNQLATAYQKTEQMDKAENAYKKLIQIDPDNKNHYLNLGIMYKDKGQLSAARTQFQKANSVANGWAQAVYYEGLLYEQAARNCEFNFDAKLVYLLAVDTYRKALSIDPNYGQARDRINALSSSIPTKEDYFFRKYKSGQSIPITGSCYSWIGKSVTVP